MTAGGPSRPAAPRLRRAAAWVGRFGRTHVRGLGILAGAGLVAVAGAVALVPRFDDGSDRATAEAAPVPVGWQRPAVAADNLAERSGVRLVRVALTGDGGLLDLRYQVIDPDKANSLHEPATPPAIVDEGSGLVLHQLLMNHAHSGTMKPAVTYYLVFENSGNWVHRGSKVTVLLGDAQVEHVVVE